MTGFENDRGLREALERILPSVDDTAADWEDVLARAGGSQLPSPEPARSGSGRRRASGARERRCDQPSQRQDPSPEHQGWGTRPIDRYSYALGLELLPDALGWGTRAI